MTHHQNKRLIGFCTEEGFYCVVRYCLTEMEIEIVFRIPLVEKSLIYQTCFFGFGVNTNTSHKYENKVLLVMLLCQADLIRENEEHEMQNEKK